MKVTLERLPESRVLLDIEVDAARLEQSLESAYKRVAARARIPGFRPGKAPRPLVERTVGREGLIREALDRLVPDVYNEAITSEDVDAIDQPELEIVELEPVRFKATVAVRPTVDLGDYRAIRVDHAPVEVKDEAVAEQLLLLRRRHATQVPVERGAQWNDILTADVVGTIDDEEFVEDKEAEFPLREDQTLLIPGLAEAFVGMSKGDEKTVDLEVPADFRVDRWQGKTAQFKLTVSEVKEEQLPDEDDELAGLVNADEFDSLEALTSRIRADLERALNDEARAKFQASALEKLLEGATLDYPKVLVDREIDRLVREATGTDRQRYLAYLSSVGRSEEDFRETFREGADLRVRRSLALAKLSADEQMSVASEDIDKEIDRLVAPMGEESARLREIFATEVGRESIERDLLSTRTVERLELIAKGEAPELPARPDASLDSAETAGSASEGETTEEPAPTEAAGPVEEESA